MSVARICKRCLLRDMEEEARANLGKYLAAIKEQDRTEETIYQGRLKVCLECVYLKDATCEACGCYVEFRAAVKHGRCPYKKWEK